MLKDYENMAVLIDFDGTITDKDTNVELFDQRGSIRGSINDLNKSREGAVMSHLEKMSYIFDHIKISEEDYRGFILENFKLTEGFKDFYRSLRQRKIPVAIVSGGFSNGIEIFLKAHGIDDLDIYAHSLVFDGEDIKIDFYPDPLDCCQHGPCGNCKILRYREFKKIRENIVFIGDGFTDRWVAGVAELLFAKSDLVDYCEAHDIDYLGWEDFNDISRIMFD